MIKTLNLYSLPLMAKYQQKKKFKKPNKKNNFKPKKSSKIIIQEHPRFEGIFVTRGKDDSLATKNMTPGFSVYNEKRIVSDNIEFRQWNPYRSKLAAGIQAGCDHIYMKPGCKVLYLGAASGTTVSHVSDLVGPTGVVYAVEFSQRSGRDLMNLAKKRPNIVPIIEDARYPQRYRMIVPMVDCIFSDVAQPDQSRIVILNANYFLKSKGGVLMSIKANCVDSTVPPATVFAQEVNKLREGAVKPKEQVFLEPFEKDHAMVIGVFKPSN